MKFFKSSLAFKTMKSVVITLGLHALQCMDAVQAASKGHDYVHTNSSYHDIGKLWRGSVGMTKGSDSMCKRKENRELCRPKEKGSIVTYK